MGQIYTSQEGRLQGWLGVLGVGMSSRRCKLLAAMPVLPADAYGVRRPSGDEKSASRTYTVNVHSSAPPPMLLEALGALGAQARLVDDSDVHAARRARHSDAVLRLRRRRRNGRRRRRLHLRQQTPMLPSAWLHLR